MIIPNRQWLKITGLVGTGSILLTLTRTVVFSQTAPGLAIAPTGTNQLSITITNAISTDSYELWWTPVLSDPVDFPWTVAAVGNIGQTNFFLSNWGYPTVFFRGLLDTNAVPLWESANPNNPASGILKIIIASPANGSTLN